MHDLKNICDKCFRTLGSDEQMFWFYLVDDNNHVRVFKGHEDCVSQMLDEILQIYGSNNGNQDSCG